jgi:hypothetical protein
MRLTTYTPYCAGFVFADAQFDVQVPELSLATCPPLFELGAALRPFLDVIQHFLSAAPSPAIVLLQRTATSCLWTRATAHDTLRPTLRRHSRGGTLALVRADKQPRAVDYG